MSTAGSPSRFALALERLQADRDSIPWVERRGLVRAMADSLGVAVVDEDRSLIPLLDLLAEDKKWEVRQEVAEILAFVPDEHFVRLAGRLTADSNRYVRNAAERSLERRRRTERDTSKASRGVQQISAQFEAFARKYGDAPAQEAIRLSEQQFNLLAQSMVHDVLNLLTPLKDYVRHLQGRLPNKRNSDLRDAVAKMAETLDLLQRSIRDIETYCQPLPIERQMESLAELVRSACDMARKNISELGLDSKAIAAAVHIEEDIRLPLSRHLMIQALMNIITNAYEACLAKSKRRPRPRIGIEAAGGANAISIAVVDTGVGLSEENLRKLKMFLPGRKNMTKRRSTGYGLLIAKRNVEAHGGELDIQSRMNEGTTVTIRLPLVPREQGEP